MGIAKKLYDAFQWRWHRLLDEIPEPALTHAVNDRLFAWMNTNAPGKKALNLGSGIGRCDRELSPAVRMINLDINPAMPGLHCVADAHRLPFVDAAFDIVYSIAVLEHVEKPWRVADEIHRVLKPGGHVLLELPMINPIHDRYDYFRFTDLGIRSLFDSDRFEVVLLQVASAGGSALANFLTFYGLEFLPSQLLRRIWFKFSAYPLSLLKHLDRLNFTTPAAHAEPDHFILNELRVCANSFWFIGRKKNCGAAK